MSMVMTKSLMERESAVAALNAALARARTADGCTVLVRGEAGIGKTSLVRAWSAQAQDKGAKVHWGGCEALFTPRPLGPVIDMATMLGAEVRAAVDAHKPAAELFAAIASWLQAPHARVGAQTMAHDVNVLVFEDVHWADHLTLDFLKYLGRRIHAWPALLVLSYRDDEVGPMHPLTQVVGELPAAHVVSIDLQALSRQALEALSGFSPADAHNLHAITGGNPFFATEVIAVAEAGGRTAVVPGTVKAAVLARAQRVSADARRVLEAACLSPGSMELSLLNKLAGSAATEGVDECVGAGLLRWQDRGLAFRHELARQVIESTLPELRRRARHAEIYLRLRQEASDVVDRMAYHAQHAQDAAAVLATAPRAGAKAATLGAHREAASHYRAALDHASKAATDVRADLYECWAYECTIAGKIDQEVIDARHQAIALRKQLGDKVKVGMNQRWLSRLHWYMGSRAEADRYVDEAVRTLESITPGPELAMAYSVRSQHHMLTNQFSDAEHWGNRAIELAQTFGVQDTLAHALNNVGTALVTNGQVRGYTLLEQSLAISLKHGFHEHAARVYTNAGESAMRSRDHARAAKILQDGVAFDRDHDLDSWTPYLVGILAQFRLNQGELAVADALADEVLHAKNLPPVVRMPALTVKATTTMLRHLGDGREQLDPLLAMALPMREPDRIVPVILVMAEEAWLRDDHEACAKLVELAVSECPQLSAWDRGELACWYRRTGRDVASLGILPAAVTGPLPCDAELSGAPAEAARRWEKLGLPRHQALVLMTLDPHEHPDALAQAIAIMDRIGALEAAQHGRNLARKYRSTGVKGIKTGPRAAARSNQFGLTPKELLIATHLAQGCSNQDIADRLSRSARTVEHHVSTVLSKLGAAKRTDVAALLKGAGLS